MFLIVHITEMCFLYNLLRVHHHVSNKDQQSEVELHQHILSIVRSLRKNKLQKESHLYTRLVYLKLEDRRRATKDGRSKMKPHKHGQATDESSPPSQKTLTIIPLLVMCRLPFRYRDARAVPETS